jgi:hypothetical protein
MVFYVGGRVENGAGFLEFSREIFIGNRFQIITTILITPSFLKTIPLNRKIPQSKPHKILK